MVSGPPQRLGCRFGGELVGQTIEYTPVLPRTSFTTALLLQDKVLLSTIPLQINLRTFTSGGFLRGLAD